MADETDAGAFAELFARLIDETFEALVEAQADQVARREDLLAAVDLDPEQFALRHVGEADVAAFVAEVVGGGQAAAAAVTRRDAAALARIEAGLAILPDAADLARLLRGGIAAAFLAALAASARRHLAAERQAIYRQMARQGLPRLVVERGRLSAKAKYVVHSERAGSAPATPQPTRRPGTLVRPAALRTPLGGRPRVAISLTPAAAGGERREDEREIEIHFEVDFRTET